MTQRKYAENILFWKFYLIRKIERKKKQQQNKTSCSPTSQNNVKYAYSRTHSHTSKQNISFSIKLRWQSRKEGPKKKHYKKQSKWKKQREKKRASRRRKKSNIIQLARKRILQFWCVEFKYKCTHRNALKALLFQLQPHA